MEKKLRIAIDGPAAAGKSTVAKIVAENLSYIYIDTGAMYRAITYKAIQQEVDLNDEDSLHGLLLQTKIDLEPGQEGQLVYIDGNEVTHEIRQNDVTNSVSITAKHRLVREEMVKRQQELANEGGVVMDGRDIGTHVIPDAEVKVFLLASVEERAKRRHSENTRKNISSDLEQLKTEIAQRDKLDSEREVSPLKKASDAVEIDTTSLGIEEVAAEILKLASERTGT
ncbi:(d)CMP kinase [Rossellomorea vietnamensis]|uniref:Cytidylate kinase n=1 Tax=Rossellomorea vietnamensis TaxID=218284 RepID=A0A5D4NZV9_9BACI|nr:(d)CMP kinase [Rossellomorea vietnamensis]TYS18956.1 (d)CMP kinase [Rossellomorea vietnamensis]